MPSKYPTIPSLERQRQQSEAYRVISTQLLNRYVDLFPHYAWTDAESAIDLMAAEIATLRVELSRERECGKGADRG